MATGDAVHSDTDADADMRNISATIRLPPFWSTNPEIWFHQAEAQFAINKVRADRHKYDHLIASLPVEVVLTVTDILENPPETNLYSNLKAKLIERLTASEEQRLDKILTGSEMGSRKPSEFFREMSCIVGGSAVVSKDLLLKLWKRRLPKTISIALTASGQSKLDDILVLADKVWEAYKENYISTLDAPRQLVSRADDRASSQYSREKAVPGPESITFLEKLNELSTTFKNTLDLLVSRTTSLETQVHSLQNQIYATQFSGYRRRALFSTPNRRPRSSSRSSSDRGAAGSNICYYHRKFGERAQKCKGPWCQFASRNLN